MNGDCERPSLLDELRRTVTVDEYLSGELPDGWVTELGYQSDETIIKSDSVDLFIHVEPDYGEETVRLCRGPDHTQSELVIQERFTELNRRKMAYDHAIAQCHAIAATVEKIANE